jgi:RNA polymerase sigma-70 factor (ECF subfamily)
MKNPADNKVAELFGAHAAALVLYARQWVDLALAEDVVQKVFVNLLAGASAPAEPQTWLFRCVRNEAISAWRSQRRRNRRDQSAADEALSWFVPHPEDRLDAAAAQQALRSLGLEEREIVTLRLWSGLTLAEIAQVTGLAISTVHGRYQSALAALREQLEPPCRKTNS